MYRITVIDKFSIGKQSGLSSSKCALVHKPVNIGTNTKLHAPMFEPLVKNFMDFESFVYSVCERNSKPCEKWRCKQYINAICQYKSVLFLCSKSVNGKNVLMEVRHPCRLPIVRKIIVRFIVGFIISLLIVKITLNINFQLNDCSLYHFTFSLYIFQIYSVDTITDILVTNLPTRQFH